MSDTQLRRLELMNRRVLKFHIALNQHLWDETQRKHIKRLLIPLGHLLWLKRKRGQMRGVVFTF